MMKAMIVHPRKIIII